MDGSAIKGVELNDSDVGIGGSSSSMMSDCNCSRMLSRIYVEGYDTSLSGYDFVEGMRKHFASCGVVIHVHIPGYRVSSVPSILNSFSLVYLRGEGAEEKALKLSGSDMGGHKVVAKPCPFNATDLDPVLSLTRDSDNSRQFMMGVTRYDISLHARLVEHALFVHFSQCGRVIRARARARARAHLEILVRGNLGKLLEKLDERGMMAHICADLDLDQSAKDVFSRVLQRFVIATVFITKAALYTLEEPSSFLDVRQKDKAAHGISSLLKPDSHLLKPGRMTRMSDLPRDLVEEILCRVPMTSLRAIRSTCKEWNALSKSRIFGKKATAERNQYFLGFIMMDYRVCSVKFDLQNLDDPSIKPVGGILNQVEITKVFHCDGLLLCVTKDNSRLVVWNPYLGQTRWIQPRINFHRLDRYALGYDKNRNHKILRLFGDTDSKSQVLCYEIYNFSSNSWKVFYDTPDWDIAFCQRGVSLKGNTYFLARTKIRDAGTKGEILLPFDFTLEKFGPPLPLPFPSSGSDNFVSLSCVRDEQLAVIHDSWRKFRRHTVEIWVTNQISLGSVSWSMFLSSTSSRSVSILAGSFFIDEEKKVAVFFDLDNEFERTKTRFNQTANIIGQDGYFKSVNIGEAPNLGKRTSYGDIPRQFCRPLVCSSSYVPSLVHLQINQPQPHVIKKEIDDY